MRLHTLIKTLSLFLMVVVVQACLNGDPNNFPEGVQKPFLIMSNNSSGGNPDPESGLNYFGAQALLYAHADAVDTATFFVSLEGTASASKDINVALTVNNQSRLKDNFETDSITYVVMPDSIYHVVSTTGVIKKGTSYATFKVAFYPSKIDQTKSFMLTIEPTAPDDPNILAASNYGIIYYHTIGNPIAGAYTWDFTRCSDPACSAGPDALSFVGHSALFSPKNTTTVTVHMGYFDGANYIVTFNNDGQGNLSNFQVAIDPAEITGAWASNGIAVATGPTITVENNNTKFTMHFTTGTRNCTDVYYK